MEEDEDTQNESDVPRSLHSRIKSPIQFINCTGRRVNMIWMNYRGEQVLSTTLSVQSNVKVNTYVTHPWIAVDEDTSERLLLNFNDVFYPEEPTIRRVLNVRSRQVLAVRKEVLITVPGNKLQQQQQEW